MLDPLFMVTLAGAAGAVSWVAARERHALLASRTALLDRCKTLLERPDLTHSHDGFPRLTGEWRKAPAILSLFPDTLTPRRFPQLWLSLTRPPVGADVPVLDILVRPTGSEAYAFDAAGLDRFEAPPGLPGESLIRGEGARAERFLRDMAPPLAALFSDPRVKEITFTPRATRLIWQAAEGDRGNHLILRQATFSLEALERDDVEGLLLSLERLCRPDMGREAAHADAAPREVRYAS